MAKDVKFNIRLTIDGKEQIVTASTNVRKFAEELEITREKSTKLRDDLLKITQVGASFQNVITGMQQLTGVMRTYTSANAAQVEAEAKLANNMRNTMGARDEDIQSIKDLCAAQQQLGVIGDEVQLAGAQELATYLEKKSSLEKLIPVMNDMVAQQYGLNATQESAANIATMLGKVMDGQVGALSRYGYKFDDAQEQILKFGTEEQRAAVLAEVVGSAVGGMNAELAKTDAGKAKQAANAIGDMREKIGALFASIEPTVIAVGELGMALMAVGTTYNGIKGVYVGFVGLASAVKNATIVTYAQAAASKVASAAQFLWSKQLYFGRQASIAWAFGAKLATIQAVAMRAAIMGLMAVTGVGIAIMAVSSIISLFAKNTDGATDSMKAANREARLAEEEAKRLSAVEQSAADAYTNAASTLEINKEKLRDLIAAKKTGKDTSNEEKKIVAQLNDTYGEAMGYFDSVSGWYNALIKNSEAYCRQMIVEAKTRQLANQIAEKEAETHNLIYDDKGNKKKYRTKRETQLVATGQVDAGDGNILPVYETKEIAGTSELEKIQQQIRDNKAIVQNLRKQMSDAVSESGNTNYKVKGSAIRRNENSAKPTKSSNEKPEYTEGMVGYFDNQIKELQASISFQTDTESIKDIQRRIEELQREKDTLMNGAPISLPPVDIPVKPLGISDMIAPDIRDASISIKSLSDQYKETADRMRGVMEDYDMGIIGREKAEEYIAELNKTLQQIGLKPIDVRLETETRKFSSELSGAFDSLSGMVDAFNKQVDGSTASIAAWISETLTAVSRAIAAFIALAGAKSAASAAETPIVGWVLAAGAAAGVIASLASICKFADGGIAYGPTLGLFGEYAGASNNPEVVAPLDRLRGMIEPQGEIGGKVTFKIEGRTLVGVLEKENKHYIRS